MPTSPFEGPLKDRWLEIYYYMPQSGGYQSEITNADFFLSPQGATQPQAEYQAYMAELWQALNGGNADKLCQYPARLTLIYKHVPWLADYKKPECPTLQANTNPQQVKSISLVFASGYFESPASYFGHTMIKLNSGENSEGQYIFDTSLNYGAKVTDDTSSPLYFINGLTGGYTASYSGNNNTIDTDSYTHKQMRDVWEYQLNLSEEQKTFLVEYAWELRRARFKYYFLNDNCANRIARIIEMTTGETITAHGRQWNMPIQVTQGLSSNLISAEVRHTSLKASLREDYLKLPTEEKKALVAFLRADTENQKEAVKKLGYPTLMVGLSQLDVEIAKRKGNTADEIGQGLAIQRRIVLAEAFSRTPPPKTNAEVEPAAGPLQSLLPTPATQKRAAMLQVGYIVRPKNDAAMLRLQAANNDFYTTPFEGQEASRFILGALEVEADKDGADLRRLTLLDIASFNTNPMPTRITGEYSWSIRAEYAPRNAICHKCSAITGEFKGGFSERFNDTFMLYTLLGPQLNHRQTKYNDYLMLASESGLLLTLTPKFKWGFGVDADISPINGNPNILFKSTLAHDITKQSDIRLSAENDGDNTAVMLKLGLYFN